MHHFSEGLQVDDAIYSGGFLSENTGLALIPNVSSDCSLQSHLWHYQWSSAQGRCWGTAVPHERKIVKYIFTHSVRNASTHYCVPTCNGEIC